MSQGPSGSGARNWGAPKAPEKKRGPPEAGVLGTPHPYPKDKDREEHVGRQEQGRGVPGRQPWVWHGGRKNEDGATAGAGNRALGAPRGKAKGAGRGARPRGGRVSLGAGHAPDQRGGTRAAENPDTRGETADMPPGTARNPERPRPEGPW